MAAYAAKTYSLSEKATRDQWDTNTRPIALDKVYYDDFCSLSKWAQRRRADHRAGRLHQAHLAERPARHRSEARARAAGALLTELRTLTPN